MPRPKKDQLHALATEAVAVLNGVNRPDLAGAVETLMTGSRWEINPPAGETVPMWIDTELKKRAQAGPRPVAKVVTEGLEKFLAGEFIPEKAARAKRGEGGKKTSLTPRLDKDLWERATAYGLEHAEDLGWAPVASQVAVAYLAATYPEPAPAE
ncbi:hypothetical protein OG937_10595 [Streptomyces sp. NBC_00510]